MRFYGMGSLSYRLGLEAEDRIASHLRGLGWNIVARRWRSAGTEIDIIALDGSVLVFLEVRSRQGADYGAPEETVGKAKRLRLFRGARRFLLDFAGRYDGVRFDLAVLNGNLPPRLFRDAFRVA